MWVRKRATLGSAKWVCKRAGRQTSGSANERVSIEFEESYTACHDQEPKPFMTITLTFSLRFCGLLYSKLRPSNDSFDNTGADNNYICGLLYSMPRPSNEALDDTGVDSNDVQRLTARLQTAAARGAWFVLGGCSSRCCDCAGRLLVLLLQPEKKDSCLASAPHTI